MPEAKLLNEEQSRQLADWTRMYAPEVPALLEERAREADPKAVVDPASELHAALKKRRVGELTELHARLTDQMAAVQAEIDALTR
jgi:hypothetical protein